MSVLSRPLFSVATDSAERAEQTEAPIVLVSWVPDSSRSNDRVRSHSTRQRKVGLSESIPTSEVVQTLLSIAWSTLFLLLEFDILRLG